jgi:hypothetical protein
MSQIQILFKQYQNNEMDAFHFQQGVFKHYKQSDKNDAIQQEILELITTTKKDKSVQDYMWGVFFEADRDMHRKIELHQVKSLAEKCFNDNIKEPHPILLKTSASLAFTCCDQNGKYDVEKEAVWLETFKPIENFATVLEEEKKYWADFRKGTEAKYKDYFDEMRKIQDKPIVESYEILVPIRFNSKNNKIGSTKEAGTLMSETMENFNSFGLEGYMDSISEKCANSTVSYDPNNAQLNFVFNCHEKLSNEDLIALKDDFIGQLSDGWGENACQRKILINKEEVTFDFILEKASDFIVQNTYNLNNTKKQKP